ncbi:penicillin-binding protein [Peribacillus muralis]|uniref:penicillin-binding protein n=1 Tax=Peribacillus muralis TaxID=264697 RepID=UPI003D06899E
MKENKNKNMKIVAGLLFILFSLLFLILLLRITYIQATGKFAGHDLVTKAEERYKSKKTIEAQRGKILDNKGNILVQDNPSYDVIAVLDENMTTNKKKPRHVKDPEKTAIQLAPLLDMDVNDVKQILLKDKKQVEFGKSGQGITNDTKKKIEKLNLPGIGFRVGTKRDYPNGDFASHVLGIVRNDPTTNKPIGISGLEKSLNSNLDKKDGYVISSEDKFGFKLPDKETKIVAPQNGETVRLTLDSKIQFFLETSINKVQKKNNPQKIIGIVSDPKTGKILAMSSRPSSNPNKNDITYYTNDVVSYAYEPGSTMKIFTLASAIEEGVYNGNDTYKSGIYKMGTEKIRDHNKGVGWGQITFEEGVQRSSNVAFALLAKKIKPDKYYQYIQSFGLDQKTKIDLPNEANSTINYKYKRDQISTAFGQGTAITPIQQIQAASAIANKGKMMRPYIIDQIKDEKHKPQVVGTPISENTASETLNILETVVSSKNGTGKPFKLNDYKVAGKTGTAQIFENGRYLSGVGNNIFSFIGFAPANDPELVVYVAIQQPKLQVNETGSVLLSEIFNPTMKNSLKYLSVKPSSDTDKESSDQKESEVKISSYVGKSTKTTIENLKTEGLNVITLGKGKEVTDQFPTSGDKLIKNELILLKTNGEIKMPNLYGWSLRNVMYLANFLDLEFSFEGKGYVVKQSIKPGTFINKKDSLEIELKVNED